MAITIQPAGVNMRGYVEEAVALEEDADTGITIAYRGDGVWRVTIPAGTDHSTGDQHDGRTFKWTLRSFVTGQAINLSDLRGNLEWGLEWVSDPAVIGGDIEITFGHCEAGDGANIMAVGIASRSTPVGIGYRTSAGSINTNDAPTPSGDVRRVRVSTDLQQTGGVIYPGNSTGVGLDASGDALGSGDVFLAAGFVQVGLYVGLNVYCPTAVGAAPVVVDVRPRYWAHLTE